MSIVNKIIKLHFAALFNWQIISCAAVLILNLLISMAVIRWAHTPGPAGTGDGIALIYIMVIGILFFSQGFKYLLSLGLSRKTYFWAGCASLAVLSAIFALMVVIVYLINHKLANVWMVYDLIYRNPGVWLLPVWEFSGLFFFGMLGWLIRLIYFVANRPVRYIVSIIPFVLTALIILFNALTDGRIGRGILEFLRAVMGLSGTSSNPVIGVASMLAMAVIWGGLCYLLLRRAQVND